MYAGKNISYGERAICHGGVVQKSPPGLPKVPRLDVI